MYGFCPLASGSKGNCIYFGSKKVKILIDAGISYTEIKKRLEKINVKIEDIDAILISHEHRDHIDGIKTLCSKLEIPVFANSDTARSIYDILRVMPKFKIFITNEEFEFEDLHIHPFSIRHDTSDPVAFVIETNGLKAGFCTDLGFAGSLVKKRLELCDYLYLEANHDRNMLFASSRPESLKKRIAGRQGHLSNEESLSLLAQLLHPKLQRVYFAHLSSECNNEKILRKRVTDLLLKSGFNVKISIAVQEKESEPTFFTLPKSCCL